jgi:hypothetical protein
MDSCLFVNVPVTATTKIEDEVKPLLACPAFKPLRKSPGLALVNFRDKTKRYGNVTATVDCSGQNPSAAHLLRLLQSPQCKSADEIHIDDCGLTWHLDYDEAYTRAKQEKKLLFVAFDDQDTQFSPDRQTRDRLKECVLVRLQVDDSYNLLHQEGFSDFHNASGVGIVDLKHEGQSHGQLVHVLPASYWSSAGVVAMIALADRQKQLPPLSWHTDYLAARDKAVAERKMLLVAIDSKDERFSPRPESIPALYAYVLLRQTTQSKYKFQGVRRRLIEYGDFQPLCDQPGIVIYDFKHKKQPYYGEVVSVMPYRYLGPNPGNRLFEPEYRERKLLTLEPDTLTRRTLTWAIRVSMGYGERQRLRSADGRPNPILMVGARHNSQLQCRSGVGHFAGGLSGPEIASPGSGNDVVDAALNMVQIWASSPPHYGVMVSYHPEFGYDMAPNSDTHWYGTGRF